MKKIILTPYSYFKLTLLFIITIILIGCRGENKTQSNTEIGAENKYYKFLPITESEFRKAKKNNYNAPFETKIEDTTKFTEIKESIAKTLNDRELELAKENLCFSPKCLSYFEAYYPELDLYSFNILDLHYVKVCFVSAKTNEVISDNNKFRGEFGVMSKDGLWVGLERQDCDNFLQIDICKPSYKIFSFDFVSLDINEEEKTPIFWVDKNTIYLAVKEDDKTNGKKNLKYYYALKFNY